MMHILYDGKIYAAQKTGGISRYFNNLINLLPESVHPILTTSCKGSNNLHYPKHPNLVLRKYKDFRPRRLSDRARAQYFRWINNHTAHDVYHPTYYDRFTRNSFEQVRAPIVITVYDMIHEIFEDALKHESHIIQSKQQAIAAADAVLCISNSTKADLLKYFPEVEGKVTVTHLASDFRAEWAYGEESVPPAPYFLHVGGRHRAYKNFDTLLTAFSKVLSLQPDAHLAVVGASFRNDEQQLIAELNLAEHIHHYCWASDTHLAKLYRCAEAFVYPSLYEGFGIPPLEAMICGTIVVAANSSSIPEVIGDAGILFEPRAVDDLTDILLNILSSQNQRERLIMKGYNQAKKFSWRNTVDTTMKVYRSLLS